MKKSVLPLLLFIYLILSLPAFSQSNPSDLKIWLTKPAANWNEALPVGNGRLGAMVFGGIEEERLQLNEESVWTGQPRWDANPEALKTLPKVRQLLFEGKYQEAEKLAQNGILGKFRRDNASSYQTLGDLTLDFGTLRGVTNYKRELDISEAIARVSFTANQVNYTREVFSSAPDQAIIIRITGDKEGSLTFTARLSRPGDKASIIAAANKIAMSEHVGDGLGVRMTAILWAVPEGGKIVSRGDSIRFEKANSVTLFLTAATDYSGTDPVETAINRMNSVSVKPYKEIRENHITDYQSFFNRVSIDLGSSDGRFFTTDSRITAMQNGYTDTDLVELYY